MNLLWSDRWSRKTSRSTGNTYFFCARTNISLWEDITLPTGWAYRLASKDAPKEYVSLFDESVTTFDRPTVSPSPPPSSILSSSSSSTSTAVTTSTTSSSTAVTSQLSFQASKAAADDLISKAYIPDETSKGSNIPATIASKRDYLFSVLIPSDKLWQVQCDEVSLYSVTEGRSAERMTTLIIDELRRLGCGNSNLIITDATACIGGNSLSFARSDAVSRVNAVELSQQRARMLDHNLKLLAPNLSAKANVYCDDFCKLAGIIQSNITTTEKNEKSEKNEKNESNSYTTEKTEKNEKSESLVQLTNTITNTSKSLEEYPLGLGKQHCVFFDPPWGGPEYKTATHLDMFLGQVDVADVTVSLLRSRRSDIACTRLVAIKAPLNYNVSGLRKKLFEAGMGQGEACVQEIKFHKMQLLLVRNGATLTTKPSSIAASKKRIREEEDNRDESNKA
jgi:hypothetical protein